MGYTTTFEGRIKVDPPLNKQEIEYLKRFRNTCRETRIPSEYYVDRSYPLEGSRIIPLRKRISDWHRELLRLPINDRLDASPDIVDRNNPPPGQPSKWCQWVPTADGNYIEWDKMEKFNFPLDWMQYLIDHFLGDNPKAKPYLSFLQGHTLNGEMNAEGEADDDRWILRVVDNKVIHQEVKS